MINTIQDTTIQDTPTEYIIRQTNTIYDNTRQNDTIKDNTTQHKPIQYNTIQHKTKWCQLA